MSKCPYNASADPGEFEVQLMVANVAEEEAAETFHEMDAEINKLLRRIHLLEDLLQRNDIPVPELDDWLLLCQRFCWQSFLPAWRSDEVA